MTLVWLPIRRSRKSAVAPAFELCVRGKVLTSIYSLVRVNRKQFHVNFLEYKVPETSSSLNVFAVVRICGRRRGQARRYIPSESIESQRSQQVRPS